MDVIADDAHKGSTDGDQQICMQLKLSWMHLTLFCWPLRFLLAQQSKRVIALINSQDDPGAFMKWLRLDFKRTLDFDIQRQGYLPTSQTRITASEFNQQICPICQQLRMIYYAVANHR